MTAALMALALSCLTRTSVEDGGTTETGGKASNPISVNPEFSNYSCVEIDDYPWMAMNDINKNGLFGIDDMKAFIFSDSPDFRRDYPIDRNAKSVDEACVSSKIGMLHIEVLWKLQGMLAQIDTDSDIAEDVIESENPLSEKQPIFAINTDSNVAALLGEIDELEQQVLAKYDDLSTLVERPRIESTTKAAIIERCLRARNLVSSQSNKEPFGAGINFVHIELESGQWVLEVLDSHEISDAFNVGIKSGDLITAVDGLSIYELSTDGTVAGMIDPETTLVRGFAGLRNSDMNLTVSRHGRESVVTVKRNVWSGRALGMTNSAPNWNGSEGP